MNATWHAEPELLARYAAEELDDVRASSLEAHLLACEDCRGALATMTAAEPLDAMWAGIEIAIVAPRPGIVETALLRLGVRDHIARLLAATPSLRLSWFFAEAFALGAAVFAAQQTAGTARGTTSLFVFLVLAALAPVAGVAAAFGPGLDPAYEVGLAAPMRGHRLLFVRAAAVVTASIAISLAAALALPGLDRTVALWLLPALGLTGATLALGTWLRPVAAAITVGLGGLFIAAATSVAATDPLAPFTLPGQLVSALAIVSSALVLLQRGTAYEGRISA